MALAPVSVVIPTLEPNPEWLGRTINSLAAQTAPPDELIIIDVTPGGLPFDTEWTQTSDGCGLCGEQFVASAIDILEAEGTTVEVVHDEGLRRHQSDQRREGIARATNEFVARFDEDSVLLNEAHFERAVDRLEADDDVVAVGCRVAPIRDNTAGRVIARLIDGSKRTPTVNGSYRSSYFVIHATHLCPDGGACFPTAIQDDQHLLAHLAEHGTIVRDDELVALTDLPTRKQARAMRTAGAIGGGGLAAGLIAPVLEGVR